MQEFLEADHKLGVGGLEIILGYLKNIKKFTS
jgi:hypothetical protein